MTNIVVTKVDMLLVLKNIASFRVAQVGHQFSYLHMPVVDRLVDLGLVVRYSIENDPLMAHTVTQRGHKVLDFVFNRAQDAFNAVVDGIELAQTDVDSQDT